MDCYYSCQGEYMCVDLYAEHSTAQHSTACRAQHVEPFINSSNYTFVVIIQDGDGTILYKSTDLNYAYNEGTVLNRDQALLHSISSLPSVMKAPLTVIVQDLTQYQLLNIPYLAVDFSYNQNGPTVVMQFSNAGPNSRGERQYTYQFVPVGNIQLETRNKNMEGCPSG